MTENNVSACVPEEIAEGIVMAGRHQDLSPEQIVGLALRLFVSMPAHGRIALAALFKSGTEDECRKAVGEVAEVLHSADFAVTSRRVAEATSALFTDDVPEEERDG